MLVQFAYTRDAAGNPIAIERESGLGAFYYEYDALQRLAYEGQFIGGTVSMRTTTSMTRRATGRSWCT